MAAGLLLLPLFGDVRIEIVLASLFEDGAEPAILVASPAPSTAASAAPSVAP